MSSSEWILLVVLPLLLVAAGVVLLLRGRAGLAEARRVKGGFGGPPGSHDIGLEVGLSDPGQERRERLAAQRQVLRGWVLLGAGLVWLVVALIIRSDWL